MSSNWERLQQRLQQLPGAKRKRKQISQGISDSKPSLQKRPALVDQHPTPAAASPAVAQLSVPVADQRSMAAPKIPYAPVLEFQLHSVTTRVAIDCEMVGVGSNGVRSALAQVVVVSWDETVLYSTFVRPPETITDYRTAVSGIRPEHMRRAIPLRQAQNDIANLLKGRVVIGHALRNDLRALLLTHPRNLVRDTSLFPSFRRVVGEHLHARRLKDLAEELLGWRIQSGEHNPCEDAVAAMRLYKLKMSEWERGVTSGVGMPGKPKRGGGKLKRGTGKGKAVKRAMGTGGAKQNGGFAKS